MPLAFTCPNGHSFSLAVESLDRQLVCPLCQATVETAQAKDDDDVLEELAPGDLLVDDDESPDNGVLPDHPQNLEAVIEAPKPEQFDAACPLCSGALVLEERAGGKCFVCGGCRQVLLAVNGQDADHPVSPASPVPIQTVPSPKAKRRRAGIFVGVLAVAGGILAWSTWPTLPGGKQGAAPGPSGQFEPQLQSGASVPLAFWKDLHNRGRQARSGLFVGFDHAGNQRRVRFSLNGQALPSVSLKKGEGIPLLKYEKLALARQGWTDAALQIDLKEASLTKFTKQTDVYSIVGLNDFGSSRPKRLRPDDQNFDHRHVWSADGRFLYVLAGPKLSSNTRRLLKIDRNSWTVQQAIQLKQTVTDFALTAGGIVLLVDTTTPERIRFKQGQDSHLLLIPNEENLKYYVHGLIVLDPDSLRIRSGWVTPRVSEIAGSINSNQVYLRSPKGELLVVDIARGSLLNGYAFSDFLEQDWQTSASQALNFNHPQLSADGKLLITHGMNNTIELTQTGVELRDLGPRSINVFSLNGESISWQQSRRIGGQLSRLTRRSDVGLGSEFLWLPASPSSELVAFDALRNIAGKLPLPANAAIALDASSKSMFCSWPDWQTNQLKFRMLRGDTDTEITLAQLEPDVPLPGGRSRSRRSKIDEEHHNLWPFEMSVSPDGQGALVFGPNEAFWVKPKLPVANRWGPAFKTLPNSSDDFFDTPHAPALQRAHVLTRCRAATALLEQTVQPGGVGTAFCIDPRGYFLTCRTYVSKMAVGETLHMVLNAGGAQEQRVQAELVRMDEHSEVALLKTTALHDLVALPVGGDSDLSEASPLTGFGFSETGNGSGESKFIGLNVQAGKVTALRMASNQLVSIQFDGALIGSNSGGPVVDSLGNVVGIIQEGITQFGLSFLTPANQLEKLGWPELKPAIQAANQQKLLATQSGPPRSRESDLSSAPAEDAFSIDDDLIAAAKSATALVVLPRNTGFGSAFCVDSRGLFVTNDHVVKNIMQVELVLNSGGPTERVVSAIVVRRMPDTDLALLQVEDDVGRLPTLQLSAEGQPSLQSGVLALGFPFGNLLAIGKKRYPNISVNAAPVKDVAIEVLGHEAFEFQTQMNPGNSGGPVIDEAGHVVGVVFATNLGARKSYAIPLEFLRELVYRPEIDVAPLTIDFQQRHQEMTFPVRIGSYLAPLDNVEFELVLQLPDAQRQRLRLQPGNSPQELIARGTPFPSDSSDFLRVQLDFKASSISGIVADRQVMLGTKAYRLSELTTELLSAATSVAGLEALTVHMGELTVEVDASTVMRASFESAFPKSIPYTVIARKAGRELHRLEGGYQTTQPEANIRRVLWFPKHAAQAWRTPLRPSSLPPLKVKARFTEGNVSGFAHSRQFQIDGAMAGEAIDLGEVRSLRWSVSKEGRQQKFRLSLGPKGTVQSRSAHGSKLVGLDDVPVQIGPAVRSFDLSKAHSLHVEDPSNVGYIPLRTEIRDLAVGGSGRWLVLHLPDMQRLVVFDSTKQQVRHQIQLPTNNIVFAAGQEKLIVILADSHIVQRWDLTSGDLETSAPTPTDGSIRAAAMGASSRGPLLAFGYDDSRAHHPQWTLFDLQTLNAFGLQAAAPDCQYPTSPELVASANGNTFGSLDWLLTKAGGSYHATGFARTPEQNVTYSPAMVLPSLDGKTAFYRGELYSPTGDSLASDHGFSDCISCYDPEFSLRFGTARVGSKHFYQMTLCRAAPGQATHAQPPKKLIALNAVAVRPDESLSLFERYHAYPDARLLVAIPSSKDRLLLYPLPKWR